MWNHFWAAEKIFTSLFLFKKNGDFLLVFGDFEKVSKTGKLATEIRFNVSYGFDVNWAPPKFGSKCKGIS